MREELRRGLHKNKSRLLSQFCGAAMTAAAAAAYLKPTGTAYSKRLGFKLRGLSENNP